MLEIKKFDAAHLDGVLRVENECFDIPWSRKSLEEQLYNPNAVYYVILEDERVVGYAGMWHIIDEGDITNIGILKDKRRLGYAGRLIEKLIGYAEEHRLSCINLEVKATNSAAIALYKKHGFYEVGIRKNYYQGKEDALLLRRDSLEHIGN